MSLLPYTCNYMCLPFLALKKKIRETKEIKESFIVKIDRTYNFTFFQSTKTLKVEISLCLSYQQTDYL